MKTTRRLLALITVLALVLALGTTAFAATITIDNPVADESYTVYKIFDATTNATGEIGASDPVSYTISSTSPVWSVITDGVTADENGVYTSQGLTFTPTANDPTVYVVEATAAFNAATFATFLKTNVASLGTSVATLNADNSYSKADLATGYYFVTSSLGSLCALATEDSIQTITEKNTAPSVDKKQSATAANYADAALDLNIGDTVYYQVVVTDGKGTDAAIKLTDTMTDGITLNKTSVAVKNNDATVDAANYTLTTTDHGFELTLNAAYVATLGENETVTVTYNATVNTSAVVDNATANKNDVTLTYSAQSMTDTVYLSTYDFLLKKTDGTKALAGAEFNLYTAETGGTAITFTKDATGYCVSATGDVKIEAGDGTGVNIRGLKPGTYYLEETVAPAGYNKLTARQAVEIKAGATGAVEVVVVNQAGTTLPSTGGMGTTIFYLLGGLMVLGALVVMVTNKRMRAN